jgi:hypothetical protein
MDTMINIEIDEDVIAKADKCTSLLGCLNNKDYQLCKVVPPTNGNGVVFIECREKRYCNYKNIFGYSLVFCSCPVRKEIYRKYGI